MNKLLVVGWDGATFDVIRPMIAAGELPVLARILREGAHGPLRSTLPPSSAVAWPTFYTGRNPAGHGVFSFYQPTLGSYQPRLVNSRSVRAPAMWDWLGRAGLRCGVINVPVTYPPRPLNGFMVTGMLTPGPEEAFTYPAELGDELLNADRPFLLEAQLMKHLRAESSPEKALEMLLRWTEDLHSHFLRLLKTQAWDAFFVVYRPTDIIQHFLGFTWLPQRSARHEALAAGVRDGIQQVYRLCDRCLGELLAAAPPDTPLLLVSDHGAGPVHGRFSLANWLVERGDLAFGRASGWQARFSSARRVPLRRILARLGFARLAGSLPPRLAELPLPAPQRRLFNYTIDWSRTRVYLPYTGAQGALLRLNLRGREPQGVVPLAQAPVLLAELAAALKALRTPQGSPLFAEAAVTAGEGAALLANPGPDLIAMPDETHFHTILTRPGGDQSFLVGPPARASGQHRMHGIFAAWGPPIQPDAAIPSAGLVDIAPTVLHLLGMEVPQEMDGDVLTAALRPEWLAENPVHRAGQPADFSQQDAQAYTPEEAARLEDTLRALGYLD
jgi:predicted AlkP superfamily phosphohydrolase/phosphomutase